MSNPVITYSVLLNLLAYRPRHHSLPWVTIDQVFTIIRLFEMEDACLWFSSFIASSFFPSNEAFTWFWWKHSFPLALGSESVLFLNHEWNFLTPIWVNRLRGNAMLMTCSNRFLCYYLFFTVDFWSLIRICSEFDAILKTQADSERDVCRSKNIPAFFSLMSIWHICVIKSIMMDSNFHRFCLFSVKAEKMYLLETLQQLLFAFYEQHVFS